MNSAELTQGGFCIPKVYEKSQRYVEQCLSEANIDYADITKWSFPDEFLCFVLETGLLKFIDSTYPNPREKNEVPIWFLITCQFIMRLHQTGKYSDLRYLLNSGSLLTRFGYNVGSKEIGFNYKNKKPRKTVIHDDTVRKFFKDTNSKEICEWYCSDLQQWFRKRHAFDHSGLFVLDQSHLVVPNNKNYVDAVRMPVDEHGQLYSNLGSLTPEQKKSLVYHPCYTLSVLLNVSQTEKHYHVAGYELGPGNMDELPQAEKIVPQFCRKFPGVMKELIVDRGYIKGEFFSKLKQDYQVDVLVPLKTNMASYKDAIIIAHHNKKWETVECETDHGKDLKKVELAFIPEMDLWDSATSKQQVVISKETPWDYELAEYNTHYFVLASTKQYKQPIDAINRYRLRMQVEERFRQFKHGWTIAEFPSPHRSLIESHVCFTLFTYSLLQLYLKRHDLQAQTRKMIKTLRADERLGTDAVLVYSGKHYGVFDLDDYTVRIAGMKDDPRQRIIKIMDAQKEDRLMRNS